MLSVTLALNATAVIFCHSSSADRFETLEQEIEEGGAATAPASQNELKVVPLMMASYCLTNTVYHSILYITVVQ